MRNFFVKSPKVHLDSVILTSLRESVFKNQTVVTKMLSLCRTVRAKAKAQKFFCKKQFWDEGCCKLAAASAVGIVTQGAIAPSDFDRNQRKTCSIKIPWITKGQLISKCLFGTIVSTKKPTIFF